MKRSVSVILASVLAIPVGIMAPSAGFAVGSTSSSEFTITLSDLAYIMRQIKISETHATKEGRNGAIVAATSVLGTRVGLDVPDPTFPWGLRQIDGRNNNLGAGSLSGRSYSNFGAADQPFPRLVAPSWLTLTGSESYDPTNTSRTSCGPMQCITDSAPRWISNLIADQSVGNPAALSAAPSSTPDSGSAGAGAASLIIPNTPPVGMPAGVRYNSMFTFFGQFFDHGLDLVSKLATQAVKLPLPSGDVLNTDPANPSSMYLSRTAAPNDQFNAGMNRTTPWIDQNQTYASHPSKQMFIREYQMVGGTPTATGRLLTGSKGEIGTWALVKSEALAKLNIRLVDTDVFNVPLFVTDEYGRFLRGTNGFPRLVQNDGVATRYRNCTVASPCSTADEPSTAGRTWKAVLTDHAFLDDIAHAASPNRVGYETALLDAHFVTGDGRGNENIGLTAIHTVFHSEHNRLYADIKSKIDALAAGNTLKTDFTSTTGWGYGERLFQAAKFVAEMEYQHLVFDTFVRRIEPGIHAFVGYDSTVYPDVTAEFASAVYRFGHSMLNETVARTKADGTPDNASLFDSFLNPTSFMGTTYPTADQAAGSVARGSVRQVGNEIDEFVTGALRNNLVGLPIDLAALNLARGRDVGLPSLNATRAALVAATGDTSLAPYTSWADFGRRMKYRGGLDYGASLVNFIAAYGKDASLTTATTAVDKRAAATALLSNSSFMNGAAADTGLDSVDLWMGGLAETRGIAAGMLGSTFTYIFRTQMERLQDGDRFYYLHRLAGTNLINQVASNTLADMFIRNTDVRELPADMFSVVDTVFNGSGTYTGEQNVVFVGTEGNDTMRADNGNDTLRGYGGNDWIDGDEGSDSIHGGSGNDVLIDTGLTGADIVLGGSGDDYISSGPGLDFNDGQTGNDVIVLGASGPLAAGGQGNDLIIGGGGVDTVTGDEGDDWIEGGAGADSLNGDLVLPPLGLDLVLFGNDVIIGGTGSDLMTGAGGDDILGAGDVGLAATPDTLIGGTGFDWVTYMFGTKAVNADLMLVAPTPGVIAQASMDRFPDGDVEGLSGGPGNDTLLGDDRATLVGATFSDVLTTANRALINGLAALLYTGAAGVGDGTQGNILLGGAGSDRIQGRLGNDLIDGDAFLEVWLEHRCNAGQVWTKGLTSTEIADLVRAGTIDGTCTGSDIRIVRSINPGVQGVTGEVDTAVFVGRIRDYTVTCVSAPATPCTLYRVVGPDGDDIVRNIEVLQFDDGTLRLDGTVPATVTPTAPQSVVVLSANLSLNAQWLAPTTGDGTITYTARAWFGNQTRPTSTCQTTTLTCSIPGLTNGTTYMVDVIATNSRGTSAPSTRVQGIPGTPTISGAPTGVATTAAPLGAVVSWVAPVNSGGSVITGYTARAWAASTGGTTPVASCGPTATLTCTIAGLTGGVVYYVDVIATNGVGDSLPSSPRVAVTPTADPGPTAPQTVTASALAGGARVAWAAPASTGAAGSTITGYTATAYSASSGGTVVQICTSTGGTRTCDITGLTGGVQYWVAVKATNSNNVTGVESIRVAVTPLAVTLTVPGVPLNVQASSPSARTVTTTWSAPASDGGSVITGYTVRIWQKASGGKQVATCGWTSGPLTCTVTSTTGLTPGTYYVDVFATNARGAGATSARVSVVVN